MEYAQCPVSITALIDVVLPTICRSTQMRRSRAQVEMRQLERDIRVGLGWVVMGLYYLYEKVQGVCIDFDSQPKIRV
jgi:hypothetical protein